MPPTSEEAPVEHMGPGRSVAEPELLLFVGTMHENQNNSASETYSNDNMHQELLHVEVSTLHSQETSAREVRPHVTALATSTNDTQRVPVYSAAETHSLV